MAYYYRSKNYKKKSKNSVPANRKLRMTCPNHGELVGYTQSFNKITIYESLNKEEKKVQLKCFKCLEECVEEQRNEITKKELEENGGLTHSKLSSKSTKYEWASVVSLIISVFVSPFIYAYYTVSLALSNAGIFGVLSLLLYLRQRSLENKSMELLKSSKVRYVRNAKSIAEEEAKTVSNWRIEQARIRREKVDYSFEEIDKMTGVQFENFVKNLLKANGYDNPQITKASGDEGVDIITFKNGRKIAIQCKRYSGKISNSAIQQVYSGKDFYDCHEAYVITNSTFTENAISLAIKHKVKLIDREGLFELMEEGNSNIQQGKTEYQAEFKFDTI